MPPSKSSRQLATKSKTVPGVNGKLGESSKAPAQGRKRAAHSSVEEDSEDELGLNGNALESEEEEASIDGLEDDEENDDEEEPFPELDSASEEDLEEGSASGLALGDEELDEDTDDSDYEGFEDEEDGDEEGYNSSDIEALYSSSTSVSSHASSSKHHLKSHGKAKATAADDDKLARRTDLTTDQKLDQMIAQGTVKPDESIGRDAKISHAKEGKGVLRASKLVPGGYRREYDDVEAGYGSESSTEDNPNTVGNIPMEWYDDLPHIGYDVSGRKIFRPAKGDELDKFLSNAEDPAAWTSVEDKSLQRNVQLSDKELDIIRRLERAENPDADFDPYQDTIEWFTGKGQEMVMPLSGAPEPKRRFVPSKWEHQKVMKIVKAIREGRIVPNKPSATKPSVYAIWSDADIHTPHAMYMPAPQLPPPKTAQSYNPPEEYLPTEQEKAEYEAIDKEDRKEDLLSQKYDSLRHVPAYKNLVQERFERCLDLYLAPRTRKVKLNIDPESLIPKLPSPRELRPFPTTSCVQYRHPGDTRVRGISVSPGGEWVASGSEDGIVRVWDLGNGREVWKWNLKAGAIQHVEWSPNREELLLAALVQGRIVILSPLALASPAVCTATLDHVNGAWASSSASTKSGGTEAIKWVRPSEDERERGALVVVEVPGTPKQVAWHRRGDYFATVATEAADKSVLIHQLSKHATQSPFRKTSGSVQRVAFHPSKPQFFAATQRHVKLYDLAAQKLLKTLQTGVKWISSMDVHPGGDNVVVGSYDKKLGWFDLDLSNKPFKTLRYHTRALRSVAFHPTLPLFASSSDDGTIHIFHATVYTDLMQNPLIVPLKILRGHKITEGLGVLDIRWHPENPWLVSSGADGEVRLWCS